MKQTKQAFKILGLSNAVTVEQKRFQDFSAPATEKRGWIVMNPPYGDRLGEVEKLKSLYRAMGDIFKQRCQGWNAAVFTGSAELMKSIGLKTKRKIPLWNGPIECRLLVYEMYAGSSKQLEQGIAEEQEEESADEASGTLSALQASVLEPALRTVHSINKMEKTFAEYGRDPSLSLEEFAAFTILSLQEEGLLEIHPDFSGERPLSSEEAQAALADWVDDGGFESGVKLGILATDKGRAAFEG